MEDADKLIGLIESTIGNIERADISVPVLSAEYEALGQEICGALSWVQELCLFVGEMADGELDCQPPGRQNLLAGTSKDLYYKLKHLTWQAQQVAKGDYSQRVDFLGSFSEAFNTMIVDLEKREKQILAHTAERINEAERRTAQLSRQMEHQLAHYHAYRAYTGSFRDFRERYKTMMGEVYDCFNNGEYDKGRLLVAEINDVMGVEIDVHKEYSNHEFVNASLTDVADVCKEKQVPFSFLVYVPESYSLDPKTTIALLTLMTEYVLSLIGTGAEGQRLDISSSTKNNWLSIMVNWDTCEELTSADAAAQMRDPDYWALELTKLALENEVLFDIKKDTQKLGVASTLHLCMNS